MNQGLLSVHSRKSSCLIYPKKSRGKIRTKWSLFIDFQPNFLSITNPEGPRMPRTLPWSILPEAVRLRMIRSLYFTVNLVHEIRAWFESDILFDSLIADEGPTRAMTIDAHRITANTVDNQQNRSNMPISISLGLMCKKLTSLLSKVFDRFSSWNNSSFLWYGVACSERSGNQILLLCCTRYSGNHFSLLPWCTGRNIASCVYLLPNSKLGHFRFSMH